MLHLLIDRSARNDRGVRMNWETVVMAILGLSLIAFTFWNGIRPRDDDE